MDDTLKIANEYADIGWNIIPIATNSKVPPQGFPLETFFQRKMTTEERTKWFSRADVSNIAVITGPTSGLIVVDIDNTSTVEKYIGGADATHVVKTPSGGAHIYYEYPDDYAAAPIFRLPDGAEVFAGHHYVLLPPSYVKSNRAGRDYAGTYERVRSGAIPPLPAALNVPENKSSLNSKYSGAEIQELLDYLIEYGVFKPGAHNDTLFYGSMYLIGNGQPAEEVLEMMLKYDKVDPTPKGETIVRSTIQRVSERYAKPYEPDNKPLIATPETSPVIDPFPVIDYWQLKGLYEGYEVEWLIDQWVQEAGIMIMAAPPEHYKTWLSIDMAISVANGQPFMGIYPVSRPSPVLVVQQEDYGANLVKRYILVEEAKSEQSPIYSEFGVNRWGDFMFEWNYQVDNNILFHPDAGLSLDRPETFDYLKAAIVKHGVKLCIIDPFYSLTVSDDYFQRAAGQIREIVKPIRNETGCAFLFIHHMRKKAQGVNGASASDREMILGSQFLNAVMEGAILINDANIESDNSSRFLEITRRYKDAPTNPPEIFQVTIDARNEDLGKRYVVKKVAAIHNGLMDDIYEYMLSYPDGVKLGVIKDNFETDSNITKHLLSDGRFIKVKHGTYAAIPEADGDESAN